MRVIKALSYIVVLLLILPFQAVNAGTAGNKSIYWGAYINGSTYGFANPPWDTRAITSFETSSNKKISILHWGLSWWDCPTSSSCGYQTFNYQSKQFDAMRRQGIIPMLSWHSWDATATSVKNQPRFALRTIINGDHDAYIRQWATEAKQWGHPFFLRFNHEMNGTWYPWSEQTNGNSAGEFVKAWKHVHDIFTSVGANNVTWVWCVNVDFPGATEMSSLYPGDEYVDWLAMDGYNWGTNPQRPDGWKSFSEVFSSTYSQLGALSPSKPIMIAETSSTEYGGSKAAWIKDMLTVQLPQNFPRVKAVLWFNWNADNMDWVIETSQTAKSAFSTSIAGSYYTTAQFTNLDVSPIPAYDQLPRNYLFFPYLYR